MLRSKPIMERLDTEMARRGLALSRDKAQRLIMAGRVRVNSRPAAKPDQRVDSSTPILVVGSMADYASRGAYKLLAALDHFALDVAGRMALDVGASTGGFTDVLLRRGVAHVIAMDVGYGQLVDRLRTDHRVTVIDRTNIRYVAAENLPYSPDLVVVDTSFISLKIVLSAIIKILARSADIIALIKPQFEVGKGNVGKGGIVRDPIRQEAAVAGVLESARRLNLEIKGVIESPIQGASGNREFLAHLLRDANPV
ncbi:MAG TPA: TlyA family RNA methyltransferase [Candidatus Binataceae bacterium]|nr:TlyA family RNA methyltransferase [Candidatus Binataceae bacterium]